MDRPAVSNVDGHSDALLCSQWGPQPRPSAQTPVLSLWRRLVPEVTQFCPSISMEPFPPPLPVWSCQPVTPEHTRWRLEMGLSPKLSKPIRFLRWPRCTQRTFIIQHLITFWTSEAGGLNISESSLAPSFPSFSFTLLTPSVLVSKAPALLIMVKEEGWGHIRGC